jgi:hypothetical protein
MHSQAVVLGCISIFLFCLGAGRRTLRFGLGGPVHPPPPPLRGVRRGKREHPGHCT